MLPSTLFIFLSILLILPLHIISTHGTLKATSAEIFAEKNLHGQGQIVALIRSTGVDYGNCYLHSDGGHARPKFVEITNADLAAESQSPHTFTNSSQHSKIISYVKYQGESDFHDAKNAIGTYLAGVVAGKYPDASNAARSKYNGVAPEAKLVVLDAHSTQEGFVEKNLYQELRWSREATGARIHLVPASPGINPGYTVDAKDIDRFLHDYNTSIVVAPAGDFSSTTTVGTISSPGTSKNAIVVGSVFSAPDVIMEAALDKYYGDRSEYNRPDIAAKLGGLYSQHTVSAFSSRGITSDSRHKPDILLPGEFVFGSRSNGDASNSNCDFTYRGGAGLTNCPKDCSGHGQCVDAHCQCSQGYCGNDCSVVTDSSQTLVSCCATSCNSRGTCLQDSVTNLYTECSCHNDTQIHGLYCLSTYSELSGNKGFNALQVVASTNTAAAVGAALAAVVRQYFMEGFYPTGAPISSNAFEPTNSLLKALFVNGARQARQVVSFDSNKIASSFHDLSGTVTPQSGHGLVALDKVLPIAGHNSFRLLVKQDGTVSTGESHSWCYRITDNGDFKVTLAWTDPPSETVNSKHLINNLDLEVIVANRRYLGNQLTTPTAGDAPVDVADETNNVESVYVENVRSYDRIQVTVHGSVVSAQAPQTYSLVMTGHFEGDSKTFCPECYVGEHRECVTSIGRGYKNCTSSGFFSDNCIMTECYTGYSLVNGQCELGSFIRTSKSIIQILEGERSAFKVILVDSPASDVRMTITAPSSGRRIRVRNALESEHHATTELRFTALDWSTPQIVYVESIPDRMARGDYNGSITIETESSDFNFNTRQVRPVQVLLEDVDRAFVIASKHNVQLVRENQLDIVKLSLNCTPAAPVYVQYEIPADLKDNLAFQTEDTSLEQVHSVVVELNDTNWNTKEQQLLIVLKKLPENSLSMQIHANVTSQDAAYHNAIVPPLVVNLVVPAGSEIKNPIVSPIYYVNDGVAGSAWRMSVALWVVILMIFVV